MNNRNLLKSVVITFITVLALVLWMIPTSALAEDTDNTEITTETVSSVMIIGDTMMYVGQEDAFKAYTLPMVDTVEFEWVSSDPSVVSIDADGKAKAVSTGTTTITVTEVNSGRQDSCKVTVFEAAVESVSIDPSEIWVLVDNDGPYYFDVTVQPSNACQKFWWPGNKGGDVQVSAAEDGNGYYIDPFFKKAGTYEACAMSSADSNIYAILTVNVCDPTESLTLTPTSLNLQVGEESTISATVKPSTACPNVTWTSSDDKIVSVTDGKVTGIKAGTATITATSLDGKTATCKVTVKEAAVQDQSVIIYRLYNPSTGEHLYTTDAHEKDVLYQKHGWGFEGIGWYAPSSGEKVYRLFQPGLDNHLYTTDVNEVKVLTSKYGWVMDNNGEAIFYSGGDVPIYRVYNPSLKGLHHLTTDLNEYNTLPKYGWQQEGLKFYAKALGSPTSKTQYYKK